MANPTFEDCQLSIADLTPASGLTDQYDNLLQRLCDTTTYGAIGNPAISDINTQFCHHMRQALLGDTVYICNRNTLNIVATSSRTTTSEHCDDTDSMHNAITATVSDLWNCVDPLYMPQVAVFPDSKKLSFIVMPLPAATIDRSEQLLIAVDAEVKPELVSHYFAAAVWDLYKVVKQHKIDARKTEYCEMQISNSLQWKFRNSSNRVTEKRLTQFKQQLKEAPVSFNDVASDSRDEKSPATLCMNLDPTYYAEAKLWGNDFRTALDIFCLIESCHAHKTLCENNEIIKFEASRPLLVKAHAQSFNNEDYIETLKNLLEMAVVHASKIQFDIISYTGLQSDQQHVALQTQVSTLLSKLGVPHT